MRVSYDKHATQRARTDTGLTINFHALAPRKYKKQWCRGSSIEFIEHAAPGTDPPSFYEPIMTKI